MTPVRTIAYTSWAEFRRDLFVELFPGARFERGRYLFRGAGDADWKLTTAFDRRFGHIPLTERMTLWDQLVSEWQEGCRDAGVPATVLDDERALWALGQHHGLPTRMLDWSLSPYVAAFFAFRSHLLSPSSAGGQVAVWVLHTDDPVWSGTGVELVTTTADGNSRLRNQGGRFTVCRAAVSCLEEYVERLGARLALTRCVLPASEAAVALGDLDAMGITDERLFPGLGGVADQATMRASMNVSVTHRGPSG
jgi:FRG domain-containing protein